jgi:uncharacterized membrane protein YphA (DoxX/SURF4 family)
VWVGLLEFSPDEIVRIPGLRWDMVGWTQIVAGVLLVTQRFATVAALVLFGVTVNIAAVDIAFWPEFATTMTLTAFAGVSLSLLLLHDFDKWRFIFWKRGLQQTSSALS